MIGPSISQPYPSRDSSLIANKDLRKAAILIEQGKSCKALLSLQEQRGELLLLRIGVKDSIISSHALNATAYESIISNYKKTVTNYEEAIAIKDKTYAKEIKKQKLKTFFIGLISALTIGYLLVK